MAIDGDMDTFSMTEEGAGLKVYNKIEYLNSRKRIKYKYKPGDKTSNEKLHQFQKITFRSDKKVEVSFLNRIGFLKRKKKD